MAAGHQLLLAGGGSATYRASAVNFDGTNDYLTRGADLTGAADSKLLTGSFWLKMGADGGSNQRIFANATTLAGATNRLAINRIGASNVIRVQGMNAGGSTILQIDSTTAVVVADGWVHIMFSVDLSDTGKRHLYRNGASDLTVTTYTDDTMDLTVADASVGAQANAGNKLNADLADFALWYGVYVDLSVAGNRELFRSAAGKPVHLSAAIAALGTPTIRLEGPASGFHTNLGSGGGFTLNGALTDSANSPSD